MREFTGKVMGETWDFDTTGVGDVDGDGVIDFLVTSAWSAINGGRSGRMFIISGARQAVRARGSRGSPPPCAGSRSALSAGVGRSPAHLSHDREEA